jgi:hypothetical protein
MSSMIQTACCDRKLERPRMLPAPMFVPNQADSVVVSIPLAAHRRAGITGNFRRLSRNHATTCSALRRADMAAANCEESEIQDPATNANHSR